MFFSYSLLTNYFTSRKKYHFLTPLEESCQWHLFPSAFHLPSNAHDLFKWDILIGVTPHWVFLNLGFLLWGALSGRGVTCPQVFGERNFSLKPCLLWQKEPASKAAAAAWFMFRAELSLADAPEEFLAIPRGRVKSQIGKTWHDTLLAHLSHF